MRKIYEAAFILIAAIGWWGFVYPEMCLTEDVYEQAYEEEDQSGLRIGDIRIKSRLVEYLYQEDKEQEQKRDKDYDK